MSGIEFDSAIHKSAARLGARVTERAIKLEITKLNAERFVSDSVDFADPSDEDGELNDQILSFLALLSLRARYLSDMAAGKAGIAMRHPKEDMDRLLKEAFKYSHEIDSGDEESWY